MISVEYDVIKIISVESQLRPLYIVGETDKEYNTASLAVTSIGQQFV